MLDNVGKCDKYWFISKIQCKKKWNGCSKYIRMPCFAKNHDEKRFCIEKNIIFVINTKQV